MSIAVPKRKNPSGPVFFSHPENLRQYIDISSFQLNITSLHYFRCNFNGFIQLVGGKSMGTAPGKGRDKISGEARSEYICIHAHYRTGIEHGVDPAFGMVSHDKPAKGQSARDEPFFSVIPEPDQ